MKARVIRVFGALSGVEGLRRSTYCQSFVLFYNKRSLITFIFITDLFALERSFVPLLWLCLSLSSRVGGFMSGHLFGFWSQGLSFMTVSPVYALEHSYSPENPDPCKQLDLSSLGLLFPGVQVLHFGAHWPLLASVQCWEPSNSIENSSQQE